MLVSVIEDKLQIIVENVIQNTEKYINTKGVFVLVALIENTRHADTIRSHLNKYSKLISQKSNLKGVQLLQDLLN